MKTLFLTWGLLSILLVKGQVEIIPKPVYVNVQTNLKALKLDKQTKILIDSDSLKRVADYFNNYLERNFQFRLPITKTKPQKDFIHLVSNNRAFISSNTYTLKTSKKDVTILGNTNQAVFYGVQTLIQLLPTKGTNDISLPVVFVKDYPRFGYRGMHLDVSRHFFDTAFIKKYIDYLAMRKMNYFHWHLTDDHGWRVEIKRYPRLTSIGAWRGGSIVGLWPGKGNENIHYKVLPDSVEIAPVDAVIKTDGVKYGGFYTQSEIKDIVKYAADRYITVIPEIEMPAHSMAALAAYPELGTEPNKTYRVAETWGMMNKYNNVLQASETTFAFLENVLQEIMTLFPSPYVHIGGDEASKIWWRRSKETQNFMREQGIKDEVALQSYFIQRIEKFVNSKGRTIIGWDEILDGGIAPNAIVMSWRGENGGIAAAKTGHKVVMTPSASLYLNHKQFMDDDSLAADNYLPLEVVYNYEPVPDSLNVHQSKFIWGVQGNLWTEYIASPDKATYMLFPRIDAVSEVQWTQKSQKNYKDFLKRLETQLARETKMDIHYSKRYLNEAVLQK